MAVLLLQCQRLNLYRLNRFLQCGTIASSVKNSSLRHETETTVSIAPLYGFVVKCYCSQKSEPVKYTTSRAGSWHVRQTLGPQGSASQRNKNYELFRLLVILGSISVFLIYFLVLREESDIDRKFEKPLTEHIKGLEEQQLKVALEYNKQHGLQTEAIENRLAEIKRENEIKEKLKKQKESLQ